MMTLSNSNTTLRWNGDSALTLFFDAEVSETLTLSILSLAEACSVNYSEALLEAIPAYQSLTLCFDFQAIEAETIEASISKIIDKGFDKITTNSKVIEIPVCYHDTYAPDLVSLAEHCNLRVDDVIQQHTQTTYLVNMLGFLPGFLYLSGLPEHLHCPRKKTPSLQVPAGAVGIGGNQTGVYPVASPGGWHIIGQTPLSLFNPKAKQAFIAQPLDKIQFVPISVEEFKRLKQEEV